MRVRGRVCGVVIAGVMVGSLQGAVAAEKESRKCRKEIGAKFSKVVQTSLGVVESCHKARNKGKFVGDCNDRVQADAKGAVAKSEAGATKGVGKKCLSGDLVLGNYPLGDPDGTFFPVAEDAVEQSGIALLGAPALVGDTARTKCHAEIAKAAKKNVEEIVKLAVKCQNALDKTATTFAELAGACVVAPTKSGPKGEAAIAKKCAGLAGADVGSCEPLPTCVTASSTATGQALAAAIYGAPTPGCGNTIVDPGEACDDGNALTTDGCIGCQLAACGDGFVHAGVELCGDAPPDTCATPGPGTCHVTPCTPDGSTVTATVHFVRPAGKNVTGLVIAMDYPETLVQLEGTGGAQTVLDRVTGVPDGLPTIVDNDYEVQVGVVGFAPIPPGAFYSVEFDRCAAATVDQFGCVVRSASDESGDDVTAQVACSVTIP